MEVFRPVENPKPKQDKFPLELDIDHPPPPRYTLCQGGPAPKYLLGWAITISEAIKHFDLQDLAGRTITECIEKVIFPRWSCSPLPPVLSSYSKTIMPPSALTWYGPDFSALCDDFIMIVLAYNVPSDTNFAIFQKHRDELVKKSMDALAFKEEMLGKLKWHRSPVRS